MPNLVKRVARFLFGNGSPAPRPLQSPQPDKPMQSTSPQPTSHPQPQGAAQLVDPGKVTPVQEAPATTAAAVPDAALMNRGAPGQAAPKSLRDSIPETPTLPPNLDKLPKDADGKPRNLTLAEAKKVKEAVIATLQTIFDPEIPVNVYELGLVYNVSVGLDGVVEIRMTLTSPACPVAGTLPGDVERKLRDLDWVSAAKVHLVWDPPWGKHMMSEAAKLELNVM